MREDTYRITEEITETICNDIIKHYDMNQKDEFLLNFIKISDEQFQSFEAANVLNLILAGFSRLARDKESWCFVHRLTQANEGDPVQYHSYIITPLFWPSVRSGPFHMQQDYSFVFSIIATTGSGGGGATRRNFEEAFAKFTHKLSVKIIQVKRDPFPELFEQGSPLYIRHPDHMIPRYRDAYPY